jgi:hypothetical protein
MRRNISLPNPSDWHPTKALSMAKADSKTAMLADGLRYKSKASGSPFAAAASFGGATMSCFLCGKHRTRSLMGTPQGAGQVASRVRTFVPGHGRSCGRLNSI